MCDGIDNPPSVATAAQRKARKAHCCEECGRSIAPGALYWSCSSLTDGNWMRWAQCGKCHRIEKAHAEAERSMGGNSSYYVTQLLEQVKGCISEEPHYVVAFRAAWKGEPVPKKPPDPPSPGRTSVWL